MGPSSNDRVEVSAADGPLPATREAFEAIRARGGTSVDIAITNTALVGDQELIELVELETRDIAEQCGLTISSMVRS